MRRPMATVVLLGPQRYQPTLASAFVRVGAEGPVAAVTAGWEDREAEIDELTEHLGREVINLQLHQRSEQILQRDPEFADAWRARRRLIYEARDIYRQRLLHQMEALRRLDQRPDDAMTREERDDALRMVRELDRHHMERIQAIHAEFELRWCPSDRESVAVPRTDVAELLTGCRSVAFAGGHVAVLRNRLRLFGIAELIGERPLFAWSAGAMCVTEHIVTYHDNPPQGPGDAMLLERGLGICTGIVAVPHAKKRLRLDDPDRVARFARRFGPQICVALDDASGLIWNGTGWELFGDGARRLRPDGSVTDMHEIGDAA